MLFSILENIGAKIENITDYKDIGSDWKLLEKVSEIRAITENNLSSVASLLEKANTKCPPEYPNIYKNIMKHLHSSEGECEITSSKLEMKASPGGISSLIIRRRIRS